MPLNIGSLVASLGADVSGLKTNLAIAKREFGSFTKHVNSSLGEVKKFSSETASNIRKVRNSIFSMKTAFAGFVAVLATNKITGFLKEITHLAGRYEELGIAMKTAGANAGYTYKQMLDLELALREQGIAEVEARQNLVKLAAVNIDLAKASEVARAAQDLAVVSASNSSETFDNLVHVIQSGNVVMARNAGLNVSFQAGYERTARVLGKTTEQLTENERISARLNTVLRAARSYTGLYTEAMSSAEKQFGSLKRHVDNFKVSFGEAFQPAYLEIVKAETNAFDDLNDIVSSRKFHESMKDLGLEFSELSTNASNWLKTNKDIIAQNIPMYLEKVQERAKAIIDFIKSNKGMLEFGLIGKLLFGTKGAVIGGLMGKALDVLNAGLSEVAKQQEKLGKVNERINIAQEKIRAAWKREAVHRTFPFMFQDAPEDLKKWKNELERLQGVRRNILETMRILRNEGNVPEYGFHGYEVPPPVRKIPPPETEPKYDAQKIARERAKAQNKMADLIYQPTPVVGDVELQNSIRARFKLQKELTDKIKELTLDELDYKRWALAQEVKDIEENAKLSGQYNKETAELIKRYYEEAYDKIGSFSEDFKNAVQGWASTWAATLNDMLWGAQTTFGDILKSFARMITQMVIQYSVVKPLFTNVAKPLANAITTGISTSFADGGLITRPTIFPMANGYGLAGEAGTEAVMPLKRNSRGQLGVLSSGGGQTVNIYVNNPVYQDVATQLQHMEQIATIVTTKLAPGAVVNSYYNDGEIRRLINRRGR